MNPAPKSKPLRRNSARLMRDAARPEDDAEHALKEIVAFHAKLADRRDDSARVLRKKRTKSRY
jgi:hypothetical protein